ncbi:carbohydrate-binding family 9-like protein [Mucilaginibacter sp.]
MKHLRIAYIPAEKTEGDVDNVSALLDDQPKQYIDNLLWSVTGYKPQVSFAMAYTLDGILLKYYVTEQYIKATYQEINDPVFKDTCVEFFVAFEDSSNYYNLEFNLIGTPLIAYGSGKNDRNNLDEETIRLVKTKHCFADSGYNDDLYNWELTLYIPFAVFIHNQISPLQNTQCKANFYKCGDDLPEPHFLSWNNIDHNKPNFHLANFFGLVTFV